MFSCCFKVRRTQISQYKAPVAQKNHIPSNINVTPKVVDSINQCPFPPLPNQLQISPRKIESAPLSVVSQDSKSELSKPGTPPHFISPKDLNFSNLPTFDAPIPGPRKVRFRIEEPDSPK